MGLECPRPDSEPNIVVAPDFVAAFPVKLFGLPLSWRDNATCAMVVLLAVMLQIRFSNTFMAEGGFAFCGFIGYVILRILLVNRRFPDPGQVEIDEKQIKIPASLNNGRAELMALSDLTCIDTFVYRGRHNMLMSSVILLRGGFSVRIPWLALDLQAFVTELERRGCRLQKHTWAPGAYMAGLILLLALGACLLLLFNTP